MSRITAQCRVLWAPVIDSVISLTMEMIISSSFLAGTLWATILLISLDPEFASSDYAGHMLTLP
jgi:hypothetical protein